MYIRFAHRHAPLSLGSLSPRAFIYSRQFNIHEEISIPAIISFLVLFVIEVVLLFDWFQILSIWLEIRSRRVKKRRISQIAWNIFYKGSIWKKIICLMISYRPDILCNTGVIIIRRVCILLTHRQAPFHSTFSTCYYFSQIRRGISILEKRLFLFSIDIVVVIIWLISGFIDSIRNKIEEDERGLLYPQIGRKIFYKGSIRNKVIC